MRKTLSKNWFELLCGSMLLASCFFFVGAQRYRHSISSHEPEAFADGDELRVAEVIDGDEIVVTNADSRAVLRLEGVEAFEATASDPLLSEYGKVARDVLRAAVNQQSVRLALAEKRLDLKGRLLGRIFLADAAGNDYDPAEQLIRDGYAVAYTRFATPHQDVYLEAEQAARKDRRGIWASDYLANRVDAMRIRWEFEANRD